MKVYPAYKESGYDWVGEIPEHWEMVQLKFAAPRKTDQTENVKEFGFQIALENIESKTGKLITNGSFEGLGNIFRKGDVLFNKLRPYLCKVLIAPNDGVAVSELLVLRPREDIDKRFLFYRLLENKFISVVDGSTYGAKMPRANWDFIGNLKIPVPPLPEQQAIADFLDCKTAQIDTLIEKKQRQIDLLQEQRTALINQVARKGLNPNVPMKDSGVEWLGEIPSHWEISQSKWLFSIRAERARPDDIQLSATQAYGVISQEEFMRRVGRQVTQITKHLEKRGHVEIDDFVISMRSFQGGLERAWERGCIRSSYVVLQPSSKIVVDYFTYLFKSFSYIQALRATSNYLRDGQDMNFHNFSLVALPIIPESEQKEIAAFLDKKIGNIDLLIEKSNQLIDLLEEFRAGLISEVVTGKIDVREWMEN
jgi:type I restriction enzyme, S subunit